MGGAPAPARIPRWTSLPQLAAVVDLSGRIPRDDAVRGRSAPLCGRIDGAAAIGYPPAIIAYESSRKSGASGSINLGYAARRADRAGIQAPADRRAVVSDHAAGECVIAAPLCRNEAFIEAVFDGAPHVIRGDAAC